MSRSIDGVAIRAIDALEALSVEPPEVKPGRSLIWLESDRHAFRESAWFEAEVADALPSEISVTMCEDLHRNLADWRTALPYSEVERRLVFDTARFAANPELIRRMGRVTILESGINKEVSGRELMQRWFNWRRGSDQFESTNGVHLARTALYEVAMALSPPGKLPPFDR